MESGTEWVSLLKTAPYLVRMLQKSIEDQHSYETPCIVRWEVNANEAYENWVLSSVLSEKEVGETEGDHL